MRVVIKHIVSNNTSGYLKEHIADIGLIRVSNRYHDHLYVISDRYQRLTKPMDNYTVFADLDRSLSRIAGGMCTDTDTDTDTNSEVDNDTEN
jgi:hypothetical protein